MTVSAHYYDGRSARRHPVVLSLRGQVLRVSGEDTDRAAQLSELRLSEPMGAAPRLITFPDGAFCEVRDTAGLVRLLGASGQRDHLIVRWQFHLGWIIAATLACAALVLAGYAWGLPWLAEHLAEKVPGSVVQAVSDQTLDTLDKTLTQPSRLPASRQAQIARRFETMRLPDAKLVPHRIVFRASSVLGPNAFALPSGTIVLTDGLVRLAHNDDELMGVLAHELGHVRERHGLRLVLEASVVGLVTAWYIGDVSSLLAAAPAALLQARYSREFEREADAYAAAMLRANGIPLGRLADLLERLDAARHGAPDKGAPPDYLSSHPATSERLRALRR